MRPRAILPAVAALALVSACAGGDPTRADNDPDGQGAEPVRYVALGDSYTSAPGAGRAVGTPPGCARSDNNYPRLVATELAAEDFTDASCGGATTEHLTAPQETAEGTNPPQLTAVTSRTTLVTVGIGGNDLGLVELATQCAELAGEGGSCGEGAEVGDRIGDLVSPVASVVEQISAEAPAAQVLVVGYPTILPADPARCAGALPHDPADLAALREGLDLLNQVLEEQANAHGARFVDTAGPTRGHHVCTPEGERWVEGLDSTTGAAPLHPTARGQRAMADAVLNAVRN
ncbi:SGNH/GDSL hydrolase family protein [Saccharomonospora piscinae]|uniref:SGNH/GDSL hydrolase family protein n=1 Tax=Saccharomonospora piscinae TaxID=687388 RepID=UPI00046776E9|nr:SGNH/GDSL hydrolase family protein [Saccharomonospora piscinae]